MAATVISESPRDFIAQEFVNLSTVPTKSGPARSASGGPPTFAVNEAMGSGSFQAGSRVWPSARVERRQLQSGRRIQGHLGDRLTARGCADLMYGRLSVGADAFDALLQLLTIEPERGPSLPRPSNSSNNSHAG